MRRISTFSRPLIISSRHPKTLASASSCSGANAVRSFSSGQNQNNKKGENHEDFFTSEHIALRDTVKSFVQNEVKPQAQDFNRSERFNKELFKKCGDLGLLGLTVDADYGGSSADCVASCIVHEELSTADPAFCLSYLAHSLLFCNNLFHNGNEAQLTKYLPSACSGEKVCGMAMSEPNAGTDILGMKSSARLSSDGAKYILNGTKLWITNGCLDDKTLGDTFLVYAKTDQTSNKRISLFLVEKGFKGFKLGQRIKDKLGMRASPTAELVFEDCEVPLDSLVGNEGKAVECMMRNLEIERMGLAAMSLGIAKRSLQIMIDYSKERRAFGKPILEFGQIQSHIGKATGKYLAARSLLYTTASKLDLATSGNRLETDAVKLFISGVAKDIADSAIQVLGGNGYIGDFEVERLWRDAKLLEIGGGTSESHEKNIARELQSVDRNTLRWLQ